MILGIDYEEQLKSIELQVESLLHYQDANQVELLLDSELGAALTESINFVAAKAATYFDTNRIDEYFLSAKQRKKANKENIPELGGFIDRPILRHKSSKAKEKEPEVFFYQDLNGANIYLHYLCQEFINQYVGLANAPEFIKTPIIDVVEAHQNYKLRKTVKFLNHLPENTDIRFVFVKMDDMLDKQAMSSYISQYQNLRKIEKSKKRREDEQLARIYKRNGGDNTSGNLNRHHDDDFVYIPPGIGPKIKVDELETEESYERNKNNPELYPSLKTEKSEEDEGFHTLSTTNKHLAGNAVQKIFEMEEKKMQEKIRKLSANQPVREEEPTEEDFEREFQANSIVIIKKPSKKKKGRK